MADKEVIIYSLPTCPHCAAAKEYFGKNGITYTDYNVARDREKQKEMIDRSGQRGTPVILIDGELVVGFDKPKLDGLLGL